MRRRSLEALVLVLVVSGLALVWWTQRGAPARVFVGGPILTLDADDRIVEAIAIEGETIAALGSSTELRRWAQDHDAEVVDLAGRALLPGFIDAHGHFPGAGLYAVHVDLTSPPVGSVASVGDLVERLAERADTTNAGDWIVGWGYDDTLLAERRHPTRRDLDRVGSEHPIALWHVSGHLGVVNSAGLAALGIGADTPDPSGGVIRREAGSRVPDGVLEESAADPITILLQPGLRDSLRMLEAAVGLYLRAGVTTAQSGATPLAMMQALRWASRLGLVPLRLIVWPIDEAAEALIAGEASFPSEGRFVRRGAVKLIADGSIQGYTGYLREPYHVPPGDDPSYRGYPRIPRERLIEQVVHFHRAGLQVAVHGNGDASIDDILDAFQAARDADPRPDARPIVIHAQMARDDQLDRMAALGLIPSFFSLHTYYWGDRHRDLFMGPARAARMSPARSALARGVRFTIHCDTPVVPMEPLRLVWAAVNRISTSGAVIGSEQRIGVMEALRAVTIDAAFQHFEEGEKGSLEVGKLADLVILSGSPLADPAHIDDLRVVETIVGGETVYREDG